MEDTSYIREREANIIQTILLNIFVVGFFKIGYPNKKKEGHKKTVKTVFRKSSNWSFWSFLYFNKPSDRLYTDRPHEYFYKLEDFVVGTVVVDVDELN